MDMAVEMAASALLCQWTGGLGRFDIDVRFPQRHQIKL
jgi:hypothetical protein